jgi:hypothetical protein
MTPPTLISVINQSKRVSDADVAAIVTALGTQLSRDYAPLFGLVPALEAVAKGHTPNPEGFPLHLLDVPDDPNALGYHTAELAKVFANPILDNGGAVLAGANSIAVTISHEILETLGDSPANKWADMPDGSDVAYELCDPVEGDSYDINGVSVSNFALQAWFDPSAESGSRFDFLGKLSKAFSMTAGGYMIVRTEPGQISQSFAHVATEHLAGLEKYAVTDRVHIVAGADFPTWKLPGKILKAAARRGER